MEFDELQRLLITYILILSRLSGAFLMSPVIGTKLVPTKIKIILTILCTYVASLSTPVITESMIGIELIVLLGKEFIIGLMFGLVFNLVFTVFTIAGEIIGMQSGLGMAQMNDPITNVSLPISGQLFLMLVSFLFISMDGLQLIIKIVIQSFEVFNIEKTIPIMGMAKEIINMGAWVFSSAIKIAMPAIISLLTVNFTFAIMTRAAPQMNIFSIGFPFTMVCGICVLFLLLPVVYGHFQQEMIDMIEYFNLRIFNV